MVAFENIVNIEFLLIFVLLTFIYFIISYYKHISNKSFLIKFVLILNRSIILMILLLFLFNPIFKYSKIDHEKYHINIVVDKSLSIDKNIDLYSINIQNIYHQIEKWIKDKNISSNYYSFGKNIEKNKDLKNIMFNSLETNYSAFINYFSNLNNQNDILLISDGNNNMGSYNIDYKNMSYKIYSVGIGDSYNSNDDIGINHIKHIVGKDSISLVINLNNNFKKNMLNQKIYLSNDKHINYFLTSYDHYVNDGDIEKRISLPIEVFSEKNYIFIPPNTNELITENNKYYLNIKNINENRYDFLIITGSLSQNTSIFKNKIIKQITKENVDHLYRINTGVWNKPISSDYINKYDVIFFDNFPIKNEDISLLNKIKSLKDKLIIFNLGENIDNNYVLNNFLNLYNCNYIHKKSGFLNNKKSISVNNITFNLPENKTEYFIDCENDINTIKYENNNTIFKINDNIFLMFFPNFLLLNNKTTLFENSYPFYDLIVSKLESFLFNKKSIVDVIITNDKFFISEQIDIYVSISDHLDYEDAYIIVNDLSEKTDIKITNGVKIQDNYYKFSFKPKSSGYFNLYASVKINGLEDINSNSQNIEVIADSIESKNISLNDNYLSMLSVQTNGNYSHHSNINTLLDNITIKEKTHLKEYQINIFTYKFIWLILIFLLSSEWYIRSKVGLL